MALNEQSGNMYPFITHTWNPIKGKCSHDCVYCYMKRFKQKPIRLDEKDLKTDLGEGNFIFVGSSTDMWAEDVCQAWIDSVLLTCKRYPKNKYLFQTKNPGRFRNDISMKRFHEMECIFGTTLESNRDHFPYSLSKAPFMWPRAEHMVMLAQRGYKTMITVEPVMDFDIQNLVIMIKACKPEWVNIGADSKGHKLPEPSGAKVKELIAALEGAGIEVKEKSNLKRLYEQR